MGVKRSPLSGGERRCRDTEGRRRWRKGVCGAAGAAGPHLLHQSQSRQTHATAPQAGPAGREHPGGSRRAPRRPACAPASAAPLQGPHARSFPPPRSPSRSGRPSRLGSGRACPGTPLASALAQLAPLAGRYVLCRRAGGGQRAGVGPWERGRGDEGIPGTALQGPPRPPPGTVAQGSRPPAGAATGTHPSSPTFQPRHATGASIRSPVPGAVTIPSSPLQSAAQWQAGGDDTRGTGGRPLLLLSLSFFSLFFLIFFFFLIKALQNKVHTLPLQTHHHLSVRLSAAAGATASPLGAAASEQMVPGEGRAAATQDLVAGGSRWLRRP